jgi:hypothetical protein
MKLDDYLRQSEKVAGATTQVEGLKILRKISVKNIRCVGSDLSPLPPEYRTADIYILSSLLIFRK